jgi:hypothetical protein
MAFLASDWFPCLLAIVSGLIFAWWHHRPGPWHHGRSLVMAVMILLALGAFSQAGKWHTLYPRIGPNQHAKMTTYFHFHEIWHYYVGAKYYPELGYRGLYLAYLLADDESIQRITSAGVRNMEDILTTLPREEALTKAREEIRSKFTDDRWQAFTEDYLWLASVAPNKWLNQGLFDAGFNPPPSWNVMGHPLANLMPIGLWLPWVDVLLFLIATTMIFRAYGPLGAFGWIMAYGLSYVSDIGWMAGSFFRQGWLVTLACSMACLKERRFAWAGALLAISTGLRIFPILFLAGAGVSLLYRAYQSQQWQPVWRFSLGAGITGLCLLGLSLAMFGWAAWIDFFANIAAHKNVYFVKHVGFRKIALFDDWVTGQDFHGTLGMMRFRNWNMKLQEHWAAMQVIFLPIASLFSLWAAWLCTRIRPTEAALLLGLSVLFWFEMPANYYYAFLCLLPVTLIASNQTRLDAWLGVGFFTFWGSTHLFHSIHRDDIVEFYYVNLAFLGFLLFWLCLRTMALFYRPKKLSKEPSSDA